MADVKESALTQQSDCKWVRALDANGNSIRISKEDLAAVLGGLIGDVSYSKGGLVGLEKYKRIEYPVAWSSGSTSIFLISKGSLNYTRIISEIIGYNIKIQFWVVTDVNGNITLKGKKSFIGNASVYARKNANEGSMEIYVTNMVSGDFSVSEYLNTYKKYNSKLIWNGLIHSVDSLPDGIEEIEEI